MKKTLAEIFNTLNEEQRQALYYSLGCYIEKGWDPKRISKFIWLISTLNDEQITMVDLLVDEVMKPENKVHR